MTSPGRLILVVGPTKSRCKEYVEYLGLDPDRVRIASREPAVRGYSLHPDQVLITPGDELSPAMRESLAIATRDRTYTGGEPGTALPNRSRTDR